MTRPAGTLHGIPGSEALVAWFGRVPRFHDAELLEISFSGTGAGLIRVHAWITTDEVDAEGYFVRDRHVTVSLALDGVGTIDCTDFDSVPGIIFDMEIAKVDGGFRIAWSASLGVSGAVTARGLRFTLEPGDPG